MKILVSNDDGIFAPGIEALAKELKTIGSVEVVAPDRNRSAASNSLTLTRPIRVKTLAKGLHSVEGTPTDCVHLAVTGYLDEEPDLVVSGVNDGANLGDDILYSGTVAAAMEGRHLGLPAIAVSLVGHEVKHYETAAIIAKKLVLMLAKNPLPKQTILNVNVPDLPISEIRGIEVTRLGTRHCAEPMVKEIDPRGRPIYWVGPPGPEADSGQGTDFSAIKRGYVSVTPLQIDMTHYEVFDRLSSWMDELEVS
jgi:5'-nucleotidase